MEKSRYSKYLSFDKQAIRTKGFRKISLLDVPCPQNFIPGVNRGHIAGRSPRQQPAPIRRLSSVCYQGILVNTRGMPSDTRKGLLQAGLVALTFPAPSRHATCVDNPETRPRRAMTHSHGSKPPPTIEETIDQAIQLGSVRRRSYTVPLLLDIDNIPPSIVSLIESQKDDDNESQTDGYDASNCSHTHDISVLYNESGQGEYNIDALPYISNYSSLPDIHNMSDSETNLTSNLGPRKSSENEPNSENIPHKKRFSLEDSSNFIRGSRVSIKTLPPKTLNNVKYADAVVVKASSLSKIRMASKTHYATNSRRECTLRHGTLVYPGSNDGNLNKDAKHKGDDVDIHAKNVSSLSGTQNGRIQSKTKEKENMSREGFSSFETTGSEQIRKESPKNIVSRAVAKSIGRSSKENGSLGRDLKASKMEARAKPSRKKMSVNQPIEAPRSKEEKETFNQIQDVMRSKLPKTFRTTVRMGLFTDPMSLQETNTRKDQPPNGKIKKKHNAIRSQSLIPQEAHTIRRWNQRSNTNPNLDIPLSILEQTPEEVGSTKSLNQTFPRISKEDKEPKRFDLFSIFRPRYSKKSGRSETLDTSTSDKEVTPSPEITRRNTFSTNDENRINNEYQEVLKSTTNNNDKSTTKVDLENAKFYVSANSNDNSDIGNSQIPKDGGKQTEGISQIDSLNTKSQVVEGISNPYNFKSLNDPFLLQTYHLNGSDEGHENQETKVDFKQEDDPFSEESIRKEEEELNDLMKELEGYIQEMETKG